MPPSFVCILKISFDDKQVSAIKNLDKLNSETSASLVERFGKNLSVNEVNYLTFSCSAEEKERSFGSQRCVLASGVRIIALCRLRKFLSYGESSSDHNDLSISLFENLRNGNWLLDYLLGRLESWETLRPFHDWLKSSSISSNAFQDTSFQDTSPKL